MRQRLPPLAASAAPTGRSRGIVSFRIDRRRPLPAAVAIGGRAAQQTDRRRRTARCSAALDSGEPLASVFGKTGCCRLVERQVVVAGAEAGDLARVLARSTQLRNAMLRGKLVGAMVIRR